MDSVGSRLVPYFLAIGGSVMRKVGWIVAVAMAWALSGCGPSCGDTCFRMFDESACNVQPGGLTAAELIERCRQECNDALTEVGGMNGYDPTARQVAAFELSNETQAAAWMECVWSFDDQSCRAEEDGLARGCFPNTF